MHRAAAVAVKTFSIARTKFEGTSGYDNTEIVLFTTILYLSIRRFDW
jgi:hypothetical protein